MKTTLMILIFMGIGCARSPTLVKKRHASYGITPPSSEWQQKSFRDADLYFEHKGHEASIFFSTQCEKFSDSPLVALTAQLLVGLSDIDIKKQERLNIADREALLTEVNAKIDGVERFLKIMVLRKNRCIFDGVFSSTIKSADLAADFDAMIAQFWAEAEL